MSVTLNRNIGHRGELRLSRHLSLPTPRTCPQCLAQVATPTLLRGPPQLETSFIPLPRQTPQPPPRRPNRGTLNQSPPAAQPSPTTASNLPKSLTCPFHGCAIKWRRQRRATGARWSVTSFTSASTVRICPRCKTGVGPHKPYDKRWTTFISTCAELQVVVAQVQTLPGRARCEHRQGASSELKNLIRLRHFDASVNKMCRKLLHGVFFAVDKECTFRAGLLLPSE